MGPNLLEMLQGGINPQSRATMDIQGRSNPGYIPLQNSGRGGKGYTANLQPARNPQAGQQLQMAPAQAQQQIMYPRVNHETGYSNPGPAPFRAAGYPQTFYGAPQLPVHNPELYDEVTRIGGLTNHRSQAQDPMAILRQLLHF